ncbi:MAG TPA: Nif11-like leader peptide family natural product precursor [Leptolyngbyaceae cyanobacterium M65_K2018_010]|nr:Nif11-like leader peptide family natural product precursor [Leptolyngbyaceae cyanobacterium M65_K2018_010]
MSKENALSFLQQAAQDPSLKSQVEELEQPGELVTLGESQGYAFSSDNVREVIPVLKAEKGFFGDLVESILALFGPTHDDYPATGMQPFSGDPQPRH